MESISNLDMLEQLGIAIDGIIFLNDYFTEITNGIMEIQLSLTKPKKIELFYKMAQHAAQKELKDPKEIALAYANGDNCGNIENWKDNMTYKEFHQLKY